VAADARRDVITESVLMTPEHVSAGITDDVSRQHADFGETPIPKLEKLMKDRPNEVFRADTIQELAQKLGMPDPKVLEETVRMYNSFVDAKKDTQFGQLPHNLIWKCEKPPFWAATASPALHHMCGGLRTKAESTIVLDRWNKPIPRLFAAGEITGGVHGTNRLGGNATGDCIVFGRLAGKEAAAEKPMA
jgi:urocanate reductase